MSTPAGDSARLTKKQKKASAFRDRKTHPKPNKSRGDDAEDADNAVPVAEDQDVADDALDEEQGAQGHARAEKHEAAGRRRARGGLVAGDGEDHADPDAAGHKRKRGKQSARADGSGRGEAQDDGKGEQDGAGRRKRARTASDATGRAPRAEDGEREPDQLAVPGAADAAGAEDSAEVKGKEKGKQRLILFVGNLKYTTSKADILAHFADCGTLHMPVQQLLCSHLADPPPSIRLLTPKALKPGAPKTKSKGCAFLEFSSRPALQQALKLHQSDLDGRRINVELTAGGGGKGEARLAKVKERNKGLAAQRTKRLQKEAGAGGADDAVPLIERPQRFSTTSGEGEAPPTKRTWTVGDVDDGETHRGGKKTKKRGNKKTKALGTGVNAIPVG
ncbi:hypothetical protein FA95DRAFT_813898 [Auriscalpium vulgare]|uniref:Uncharacterized protein n=1 Tax=Auriscalpium vulgare TaxID=40419 RepID=A0ACB8RA50_9AGAM|nr:hypothetical protein FA95DRAFT_813898 [Auriscalpium vulgare]